MTSPLAIRAEDVHKAFAKTLAVAGATVHVEAGELVALLGPSGSGKTTLLRLVAGFERPDAGTVRIGGRLVAGEGAWQEPNDRRVGMVFQDGALFPHLSVAGNVGFGASRPGRVGECLELVGLADRGRSFPHELSGGERQRVALARALAADPTVVLMDEPFASLDAALRVSLREDVAAILRQTEASALLVTHDQQEALSLADSVTVMRDGRVEQAGSPEELYARPATRWVAEFLGAADVVPGTAAGGVVECELGRFPADRTLRGAVDVVVRPEAVAIERAFGDDSRAPRTTPPATEATGSAGAAAGANGAAKARVVSRSFYGHDQIVALELVSGLRLRSRCPGNDRWQPGDDVIVTVGGPVTVLSPQPG